MPLPLSFRRSALAALLATIAAGLLLQAGSAASAAGWADGPWSGSGPATTTVTSDGTTSDPVFDYSATKLYGGTWTFSNTASWTPMSDIGYFDVTGIDLNAPRTLKIAWHYKGYHGWNMVGVKLEQFVIHPGACATPAECRLRKETVKTLRSVGPVSCCASPSGGFDYSGNVAFDVQPGDVYGFRMTGSNYDSDQRLSGTLSLQNNNFSIAASRAVTTYGQPAVSRISTAVTSGTAEHIRLSVSDLPPGVTASFSRSVVTAGEPSTLTFTGLACDHAEPKLWAKSSSWTHFVFVPVQVRGAPYC